jgi:predicted SnoaL-like aldol condensation-catalyzing enzyme
MTSRENSNKQFVLDAFDALFNRRDFEAAATYWSPDYLQHSAHIAPGRDGLFNLVRGASPEMRYVNSLILADKDIVMLHGKFTNVIGDLSWIVADILRIENDLLAEHWDVIQDEATSKTSASGLPMFGDKFPDSK